MPTCELCSSPTIYVPEALSQICEECGHVSNTSQIELHFNEEAAWAADSGRRIYDGAQTLKTWDGKRTVWGQSAEVALRNNKRTAYTAITNALTRLGHPALIPRASNIFDLAMAARKFRWGATSLSVVGAAVAVAFREDKKDEQFPRISAILSTPLHGLIRRFVEVTGLLKLQLPPTTDASIYLISLVKSIPSLIDHDSQLPASLRTFISPLSLESVLLLATSIAAIANSVFLTHNRYLPAVACAFLMVALEGERGSELPSVGEFAAQLAKQVNSSKRTVMERYREVGRLLQDWKSELPWVGQTTSKAKIQRKDNSRWIKDVVTFQEECRRAEWTKQAAGAQALDFAFEEIDSDLDDVDASTDQTFCAASDDDELPRSPHERKQRRLDAKSAPETDRIRPAAYVHPPQPANVLHQRALKTAVSSLLARGDVDNTLQNQMSLQSLRSFILTTGTLPTDSAPSRLAQLAAAKGVDAVEDDELFDEGELERIMRPADEVEEVREHLEQKWGSAPPKEENALIGTGSVDSDGRRRKPRTKAKKVTDSASDEVISAWRPVSPGPQFDDGYTFSEDVGG